MNQTILNRSRNDKFLFVMDLPKNLKKTSDLVMQDSYSANKIQFTTFGSPVPNIKIPEKAIPFGGQVYNTSSFSRPAYEALSLKFLIDNGYQNYWILWKWLNLFNDNQNSTSDVAAAAVVTQKELILKNPMSDYMATFSVFGLDEFNNKVIEFKYENAFITSLSPIDFSFQSGSEIICTATFIFSRLSVDLLSDVNSTNC
jgi:hypothetical protein